MADKNKSIVLYIGVFNGVTNKFIWKKEKEFDSLDPAIKSFKKTCVEAAGMDYDDLIKKYKSPRLDIELRIGNKLLKWMGLNEHEDIEEDVEKKTTEDAAPAQITDSLEIKRKNIFEGLPNVKFFYDGTNDFIEFKNKKILYADAQRAVYGRYKEWKGKNPEIKTNFEKWISENQNEVLFALDDEGRKIFSGNNFEDVSIEDSHFSKILRSHKFPTLTSEDEFFLETTSNSWKVEPTKTETYNFKFGDNGTKNSCLLEIYGSDSLIENPDDGSEWIEATCHNPEKISEKIFQFISYAKKYSDQKILDFCDKILKRLGELK